jgi:protease-4
MNRALILRTALASLIVSAPSVGFAQQIEDLVIDAPWGGGGLRADSFSLFTNPANLAYTRGVHVAAGVQQPRENQGGERIGLLAAAGSGQGLGVGLSSQWARNSVTARTLSWGAGIGNARFALGAASHDVLAPGSAFGLLRRWDLGVMMRVTRNFGVHGVVRGLNRVRMGVSGEATSAGGGVIVQSADQRLAVDIGWLSVLENLDMASVNAQVLAQLGGKLRLFGNYQRFVFAEDPTWRVQTGLQVSAGGAAVAGHIVAGESGEPGWQFTSEFSSSDRSHDVAGRPFYHLILRGAWPESPGPALLSSGPLHTDILMALREVAHSDRLRGVVIEVEALAMGPARLQEFCVQLDAIRDSGKNVILHLQTASPKALALAAHADRVYVSPDLATLNAGIGITANYLGDLLALVGVEAQFVRIGDYKSSPERFLYDGPTDPARERLDAWLDNVWDSLIADMNQLPGGAEGIEELLASPPALATELVDAGIAYDEVWTDDLYRALLDEYGLAFDWTWELPSEARLMDQWHEPNRIAVLHISGGITSGRSRYGLLSGESTTGAATVAAQADAIARDRGVQGVIVRIDSPGGDADASDAIVRALIELSEDKPMVISMGDTAASGGYYAAATGSPIFTSPSTLTGSIGIYAGSFALDNLLERVGVNRVTFQRGGRSDYFDLRRWSDDDISAIQGLIDNGYHRFIERVVSARDLEEDGAELWGEGRIFSGDEALELGLVDSVGGFDAALDALILDANIRPEARITLEHFGVSGVNSLEIGAGVVHAWQSVGYSLASISGRDQSQPAYLNLLQELAPAPLLRFLDSVVSAETREDSIRADLGWVLSWDE